MHVPADAPYVPIGAPATTPEQRHRARLIVCAAIATHEEILTMLLMLGLIEPAEDVEEVA